MICQHTVSLTLAPQSLIWKDAENEGLPHGFGKKMAIGGRGSLGGVGAATSGACRKACMQDP